MAFDPSKLKQDGKKGSFGIKTKKAEQDTSGEVALRTQQDLLTTRLNQTRRAKKGKLAIPRLFPIDGRTIELYQDALQHIGIEVSLDDKKIYYIDRTGYCPELAIEANDLPEDYLQNRFIILSPQQSGVSVVHPRYSFLTRLMDQVYREFSDTIETFTRAEALIGDISNKVINEGVEKFLREEMYKEKDSIDINVSLSTASDALTQLATLKEGTDAISSNANYAADMETLEVLYSISSELKDVHKKLGDLQLPTKQPLHYGVECFRYGDNELELYYFKTGHKPLFLFFTADENAGIEDVLHGDFIILNGNDRSRAVNHLLDLQVVDYLVEFAESVRDGYGKTKVGNILGGLKAMAGGKPSELSPEWHELNDIAMTLRLDDPAKVREKIASGYEVLGQTNELEAMRGQYVRSLDPTVKAKIIFPRSEAEDKLVCDLISRCCYVEEIELYNDTRRFIEHFSTLGEDDQMRLLINTDKQLKFENQNNLVVNYWLSTAQNDISKRAGISFYEMS